MYKELIETMYRAALRVSEVANLTPADVNLEKGEIYVQDGKNSRDRRVPIGPALMEWLSRWNNARPDSQWFFCTTKGGQVSIRWIRAMMERLSKESGIFIQSGRNQKPIWPHSLRHSCATNWLNDGLSIREVQELLGHESLNTTMKYTHISMKALDGKIKALG